MHVLSFFQKTSPHSIIHFTLICASRRHHFEARYRFTSENLSFSFWCWGAVKDLWSLSPKNEELLLAIPEM